MPTPDASEQNIPAGNDILQALWKQEDHCEAQTDALVPQMGVKAPQCVEQLGIALHLLDGMASCRFDCKGGDHTIEYMAARTCSSARAALRLIRLGFYDEALSLARSIGEITNLLFLFMTNPGTYEEWRTCPEDERRKKFSPVKVRTRLEKRRTPLPVDQDLYSTLSGLSTHVTPNVSPQAYNLEHRPTTGGYFQLVGMLTSLNDLAGIVALATFAFATQLNLEPAVQKRIQKEARALLDIAGGVHAMSLPHVWETLDKLTPNQ